LVTILHRCLHFSLLRRNPKIDALFSPKGFWFWTRMVGFLFANMIYFGIGRISSSATLPAAW
jgi:hypothetical protein